MTAAVGFLDIAGLSCTLQVCRLVVPNVYCIRARGASSSVARQFWTTALTVADSSERYGLGRVVVQV